MFFCFSSTSGDGLCWKRRHLEKISPDRLGICTFFFLSRCLEIDTEDTHI